MIIDNALLKDLYNWIPMMTYDFETPVCIRSLLFINNKKSLLYILSWGLIIYFSGYNLVVARDYVVLSSRHVPPQAQNLTATQGGQPHMNYLPGMTAHLNRIDLTGRDSTQGQQAHAMSHDLQARSLQQHQPRVNPVAPIRPTELIQNENNDINVAVNTCKYLF